MGVQVPSPAPILKNTNLMLVFLFYKKCYNEYRGKKMKKNKYFIIMGIILIILIVGGILLFNKKPKENNTISEDRTYTYAEDGFGSEFTITLRKDGTSSFYEGVLSSYLGEGTWKIDNDVLTLETSEFTNYFKVNDNDLEFIEKGSSNFPYVKVKDKEKFILNK